LPRGRNNGHTRSKTKYPVSSYQHRTTSEHGRTPIQFDRWAEA
jgi:hypothetical protein